MKISRIFYAGIMLFALIGTWGTANAQDPFSQIDDLESRLDEHLRVKNMSLNSIIRDYNNGRFEAYSMLKEYIAKKPNASDIEKANKLLAEWWKKKQKELLVYHDGFAGKEWMFYAFTLSDDSEKILNGMAELRYKVKDLDEQYLKKMKYAGIVARSVSADAAQKLLNEAKLIFNESNKYRRDFFDKLKQLLYGNNKPFYSATNRCQRWLLTDVPSEFLFLIVETVGKDKYAKVWTGRVKGGAEVTLDGRNVIIK